jgi:hypothetical protein
MSRQGSQICCCIEAGIIVNQPFHKPTSNVVEFLKKRKKKEKKRRRRYLALMGPCIVIQL